MRRLIALRPATHADADRLLQWRNDPETRALSFHSGLVAVETHAEWMEQVLRSPFESLFVAEFNGAAVGTCRLTRVGDDGIVHITVAPASRGRQLAAPILEALVTEASRAACARVIAHVKPGNIRSIRAFERAGFVEMARDEATVTFARACPPIR